MKTMKPDKYQDRHEAIAELKVIYRQLDQFISSLQDDMVRWDAILCLQKVMELEYKLRTTFAPFPVLGYNQRTDIAATVNEAKSLLKQHGNA